MIGGVHGKVLHIDLTTQEQRIEQMPEEFYKLLVGGRAITAYFLLRDMPANTDPLSPDNLLIFAPGILQGTNLPGAGRHGVGAKSPLTGAIASSEAGGWWGHEFKRTGYDALIIRGRSEKPIYLWIKDGAVELGDVTQKDRRRAQGNGAVFVTVQSHSFWNNTHLFTRLVSISLVALSIK